jgi:molybdopterin molybdotransferase
MPVETAAKPALLPVEEALARVLDGARLLSEEHVPLRMATGRVLAQPLAALRTQPPFDTSSMDGYAVTANGASAPGTAFRLIGESAAGRPFAGTLSRLDTVRIFTGARLPQGATSVIAQEDATREGDMVLFDVEPRPNRFVRRAGMDFREGEVLMEAGMRLRPTDIALAAAMGHAELPVAGRPRVGVLSTGDELARPGEAQPDDIITSNLYGLLAMIEQEGGEAVDLGIARDSPEALAQAVERARRARLDVFVSLGGASVGDHDLIRPVFTEHGMVLDFWRMAMRPGRPMLAGRFGAMRFLGLPGNPVSAMVCGTLFLTPLLRSLQGMRDPGHRSETARLSEPMAANDERQDYVRGTLADGPQGLATAPYPVQDSSMLRVFSAADCLIVRAPHAPAAAAGERVEIIRLRA